MKLTVMKNAKLLASRGILIVRKHSPEILTCLGLALNVTTVALACRATTKLGPVLDKHELDAEFIKGDDWTDEQGGDDEKARKKELRKLYIQTIKEVGKLYAPAVGTGVLSYACLIGGHHILKSRNVALMTAYSGLETAYNAYRNRVIEEFGEDKDQDYRFGVSTKEEKTVETSKNGKEKEVVKNVHFVDVTKTSSPYARCFDETNENFSGDPSTNLLFLRHIQDWMNDKLIQKGHLFLNEVYEALGFDDTQAGAVVGWIMKPDKENFVDIGIYNLADPTKRMFINGDLNAVWLDFNVDGVIYNLI